MNYLYFDDVANPNNVFLDDLCDSYDQTYVVKYNNTSKTLDVIFYTDGWGGSADLIGVFYADDEGYALEEYCTYESFTKQA